MCSSPAPRTGRLQRPAPVVCRAPGWRVGATRDSCVGGVSGRGKGRARSGVLRLASLARLGVHSTLAMALLLRGEQCQ